MNQLFWLKDNAVAGRSGPNKDPWKIEDFRDAGFSAILSVNGGEDVHESLIAHCGIAYAQIPMSDNAPPRDNDHQICLNNLPRAVKFITDNETKGPVLIHCRSGKDRTGLVMAAYLVKAQGYAVDAAIEEVLRVRPIAFTAPGWLEFGKDVLTTYRQSVELL